MLQVPFRDMCWDECLETCRKAEPPQPAEPASAEPKGAPLPRMPGQPTQSRQLAACVTQGISAPSQPTAPSRLLLGSWQGKNPLKRCLTQGMQAHVSGRRCLRDKEEACVLPPGDPPRQKQASALDTEQLLLLFVACAIGGRC